MKLPTFSPNLLISLTVISSLFSTTLTIVLLYSGTRYNICGHGGCYTVNGVSNNFLSFTAPYYEVMANWENGTALKFDPHIRWVYTWHLSAVAAHPTAVISTEDGPLVISTSPLKPFDVSVMLAVVDEYFGHLYGGYGVPDLYTEPRPTVSTATARHVKVGKVSMIPSFLLWLVQILCANAGIAMLVSGTWCAAAKSIYDPVYNAARQRRVIARVRAGFILFWVGFIAGVILALFITSSATVAANQLRDDENSKYIVDVKVGAKGIGMLWGEVAGLGVAAILCTIRFYDKKQKDQGGLHEGRGEELGDVQPTAREYVSYGHRGGSVEVDDPPPYQDQQSADTTTKI